MTDKARIREALTHAAELADEVNDLYRVTAFRVAAERLLGVDGELRQAPVQAAGVVTEGAVPEAVNELLAVLHDRPHQDRFEAIIFHALRLQGVDGLTTDEIMNGYSAARIARPANPSDVIAKCVRPPRGHVREGDKRDGQKTWRLTGAGERYVGGLIEELMEG